MKEMLNPQNGEDRIKKIITAHSDVMDRLDIGGIQTACEIVIARLKTGGKILFAGNGGSAADSQHLAAEFIGKFKNDRKPLPAIALTTDTSILTSIANDFYYTEVFKRQVSALCNQADVLIVISTSGNSENLLMAAEEARRKKASVVGFLGGTGGKLLDKVDIPIVVKSQETPRIQEAHILIGHILCEFCDDYFYRNSIRQPD